MSLYDDTKEQIKQKILASTDEETAGKLAQDVKNVLLSLQLAEKKQKSLWESLTPKQQERKRTQFRKLALPEGVPNGETSEERDLRQEAF